jgi:hypothetical protein
MLAGILSAAALGLFAWPSPSAALTISSTFVAPGEDFDYPSVGRASAAAPTAGGGRLEDVFDTAASWWEAAIDDPRAFEIGFGWQDLDGRRLARAERPGDRELDYGVVRFDATRGSAAAPQWFLDPTPDDNSEYASYSESFADLGGGGINTGRVYSDATGAARGRYDLLTLAAHEIGHVLGFLDTEGQMRDGFAPSAFEDGRILVAGGLPQAGTAARITAVNGGHTDPLAHPDTLMVPTFERGRRILPSDLDILLTAQLHGYQAPVLAARQVAVAAPASALLLGAGLLLLAGAAAAGRRGANG